MSAVRDPRAVLGRLQSVLATLLARLRAVLSTLASRLRPALATLLGRLRSTSATLASRLRPALATLLARVRAGLRTIPGHVRALPGRLRPALAAIPGRLRALPGQVRSLPGRMQPLGDRRHRPVLIAGVAVLIVVALAGAAVAWGGGGSETVTLHALATTTTTTTVPSTTTTTPKDAPPPRAPLTGLTGEFQGRLDRPALVVKIDNVELARPQSGLNQADIVVEEPVEGNLTRLAAVFHSTDAASVGPVRSVRTTDVEMLPLFGRPLFAASGGNAGVIPQLHAADVVDVGNNVSGQGFHRSGGRPAPHNLFTSTLALYGKAPESPPPPEPLFSYLARDEKLPDGAIPVGGVALRFGGGEVSRYTWDGPSGTWLRSQRGSPHVDAGGVRIAPENVVVLEITYDHSGQAGRSVPHGETVGQGRALVLTRGQSVEGTWKRPRPGDPLTLTGPGGAEMELTPGQTFVALVPPGGWSYI
ncbi:MAG TPA: DUF3048 domain-containing protein [Acidimicrobiales bacterium]|nr:DUF3048 domain-containing protein [Acidimicrobiales bacterium]